MTREPYKRFGKLWGGIALASLLLSGVACEQKSESPVKSNPATVKVQRTPAPTATPAAITKRGPNERFYTIQQSLDQGGTFYLYASVKDLLKKKVAVFEPLVKQEEMPPEAAKVYTTINQVINHLGLYGIDDIGISTVRDGDLNRTKAFIHLPEGRAKGIASIWGGNAHPLSLLDRVPQETLMLCTGDVDAPALWDLIRTVVQDIHGDAGLGRMDIALNQWGMQTGINIPALVPTLGGEVALLVDQTPNQKMVIPLKNGTPLSIDAPRLALMVRVQKDDLYQSLKEALTKNSHARTETTEGKLRVISLVVPFQPFWPLSPVLATDGEYLYLSTHADYVKTLSAGTPQNLRQSEEFQHLIKGLPTEANGCAFVSVRLKKTYQETMKAVFAAQASADGNQEATQLIQKIFDQQEPLSGSLGLRINQANGILFVSRSQADMAEIIPTAGAGIAGMMVAIAVPGLMRAHAQANVSTAALDSGRMCAENLQKMDGAKEQWALENNKNPGDVPTWDDLIGSDKYIKVMPVCPDGGNYTLNAIGQDPVCSKADPRVSGHVLP